MRSCRFSFFLLLPFLVLLFPLVFSLRAYSQAGTGILTGVVTDSTGALIPGATVLLTASDGGQQEITSDGEGRYTFSRLSAGSYEMLVASPGFSTETQTIFLARHASPNPETGGVPDDPTEIAQVRWLPLSEALEWCKTGIIVDSKTVLGLYLTHHLLQTGA